MLTNAVISGVLSIGQQNYSKEFTLRWWKHIVCIKGKTDWKTGAHC